MSKANRAKFVFLSALAVFCGLAAVRFSAAATPPEQLIILLQKDAAPIDRSFREEVLPKIRTAAAEMDLPVTIADIQPGLPETVTITPLIVYQNYKGRSIYQGRTTTTSRIRNFIRTSRYVPQGGDPLLKHHVAVWQTGRTRVWSPIKISSVTGSKPKDYDDDRFKREALTSIQDGFTQFKAVETAALGRSERGFYMDFYPWLADDGTLFLSMALYSQFHCKDPVFHTGDNPLVGAWQQRQELFRSGAALLERAVQERISDPKGGDGFTPVPSSVPVVDWSALGFDLPPAPPKMTGAAAVKAEIPRRWRLKAQGEDDPPRIQFRFPAPLDNAAGEALVSDGEFILPENRFPARAVGAIRVDPRSVTMGQKDLDAVIRSSMMLDVASHSTASYTITAGDGENEPLRYGSLSVVVYQGVFLMKGTSMPLAVTMEIEPVVDDAGTPLLVMQGRFQIDLNSFGISGPDGPAPQNHTLVFDVHFLLIPE